MISHRLLAAIFVCSSGLSFTLNDTVTKLLIADYDVSSIILIRSLAALPVLYLLHVRSTGQTKIWSSNMGLHALRGAIGLSAAYLYIKSLGTLTIAEATVILFLTPIIITIISRAVLKERVKMRTWISVIICFLGVMVAIQPGSTSLNLAMVLVGVASLMYAMNAINSRWIPAEDNLWTIAFYGAFFSALFIAPFSIEHWRGLQASHLILFGAAATFSSLGIGLSAIAYRMASPSFLASFGYSGLIWSISVTWIFWNVAPALESIIGMAIILGSVALNFKPDKTTHQ